jgi:hypothetical protein
VVQSVSLRPLTAENQLRTQATRNCGEQIGNGTPSLGRIMTQEVSRYRGDPDSSPGQIIFNMWRKWWILDHFLGHVLAFPPPYQMRSDQTEELKWGGGGVWHVWGKTEMSTEFSWVNLKDRQHVESLDIDGNVTLRGP